MTSETQNLRLLAGYLLSRNLPGKPLSQTGADDIQAETRLWLSQESNAADAYSGCRFGCSAQAWLDGAWLDGLERDQVFAHVLTACIRKTNSFALNHKAAFLQDAQRPT